MWFQFIKKLISNVKKLPTIFVTLNMLKIFKSLIYNNLSEFSVKSDLILSDQSSCKQVTQV